MYTHVHLIIYYMCGQNLGQNLADSRAFVKLWRGRTMLTQHRSHSSSNRAFRWGSCDQWKTHGFMD